MRLSAAQHLGHPAVEPLKTRQSFLSSVRVMFPILVHEYSMKMHHIALVIYIFDSHPSKHDQSIWFHPNENHI